MTTSSYMPNVVVEICFTAGYGSPTRVTWVDVSDYVDNDAGISISVGRGDERSEADANQLTLTLDNRDGRFTPDRVTSPYYPNVKLDRPIRVTATPVDGPASVRFLGFISEWPVEWEGSDGYAKVTISASSRLARLGQASTLLSIVEQTILPDSPLAYYTLGEPDGAPQANDSSGNTAPPLLVVGDPVSPITFGNATGPGTDGLTAVTISNAPNCQYLQRQLTTTSSNLTIETTILVPATATQGAQLFSLSGPTTLVAVSMNSAGVISARNPASAGITSSVAASRDTTHNLALTFAGATWTMILDGVQVATGSVTSFPAGDYVLTIGAIAQANTPQLLVLSPFNGSATFSHVALFASALTVPQIAAHWRSESDGFAGETTSARLARYAGYAGVPSDEIAAETGQVTVQHVDTSSKQPVELMRLMETTEGGVLFDDRTGALTFHNRAHRVTAASAFTLDMTQHMVEAGYSPKLDRSTLLNDITGADVSGKFTARVFDATSRTDYGVATSSVETASDSPSEPLFLASWLLYKYKTPKSRVAELSVDALAQVGKTPNCATVMAANVGTKVTVAGHPQQAAYSSTDYFVEGYSEVYGPESLRFTFNVSPSSPDDMVLVVDDPARGVVDTNPVAL